MLATYEGTNVDWGTLRGAALREGLHDFQSGKKLRPIIQQYFTILFPPRTLPAPTTRPSRRRLEELTTSTWEEDNSGHPAASPPRQRSPTPPSRRHSPSPPTTSSSTPRTTPIPNQGKKRRNNVHACNQNVGSSSARMEKDWLKTQPNR